MNLFPPPFSAPGQANCPLSPKAGGAALPALASLLLASCASLPPPFESDIDGDRAHLQIDSPERQDYLPLLRAPVWLPDPVDRPAERRYSLAAENTSAGELLFSLARDAGLNLELPAAVDAEVTLIARDRPLAEIVDSIARQSGLIAELRGNSLRLRPDEPHSRTHEINYLNMSRATDSRIDLATRIDSLSLAGTGDSGGHSGSQASVVNSAENHFWDALKESIEALMSSESGDQEWQLSLNREAGLALIHASERGHSLAAALIGEMLASARRQVLIEATVSEVTLDRQFESGVDWHLSGSDGEVRIGGGSTATGPSAFLLNYSREGDGVDFTRWSVRLLDRFGDVSVLSSPKIITLNNQPAILKIVDNRVYFSLEVENRNNSEGEVVSSKVSSSVHSAPIGVVIQVLPFIDENGGILLNIRPTLSRVLNFVVDPNPELARAQVVNQVPEVQIRELEAVLKIASGQVAMVGGMMQDVVHASQTGIPGLGRAALLGPLFSVRNRQKVKSELVILLRATALGSRPAELADFLPLAGAADQISALALEALDPRGQGAAGDRE